MNDLLLLLLLGYLVGRALVRVVVVAWTAWTGEFQRSWHTVDIGLGIVAAWLLVHGA